MSNVTNTHPDKYSENHSDKHSEELESLFNLESPLEHEAPSNNLELSEENLALDTPPLDENVPESLPEPIADLPSTLEFVPLISHQGKRPFAIANTMAQATDLENLYQVTVNELRKQFATDRALIYQFQSATHGTVIAESITSGYCPMLGQTLASVAFGAPSTQHYQQQVVVSFNNITEEAINPYQAQIAQHFQMQASLALPLFLENQLWGLLVVQTCTVPRQWKKSEIALLYQVGSELILKLQPLRFQSERQLISSLSDKLRQTSDREAIFRSVTRGLRKLLNVERVAICRLRHDYTLQFISESRATHVSSMLNVAITNKHLQTQNEEVFQQFESFVVNNSNNDPTPPFFDIDNLTDFDIKACATVAIYQGQELWGLLGVYQHSGPRYWEDNDIKLMTQLSNLLGLSLHRLDLMEENARASAKQKALPEVIKKIGNTDYAEKIYQTAVQEVRNLLNVERVCIYKFRPNYFGDFIYESGTGEWPSLVGSAWEDTYMQENQGGRFQNTEQPYLADDVYTAGLSECHLEILEYFGIKSFLVVAIRQEGKLWGLLSAFQHSDPRHWQDSDVKILQDISRQMEVSLKGADYVARLKEQSTEMTKAAQIGSSIVVPQILQARKPEQILKITQRVVRQLMKCDRVAFHRFHPDHGYRFIHASSTSSPTNTDTSLDDYLPVIWPKTDLQETQGGPYRDKKSLVVKNIYTADHSSSEIELLEEFSISAYITVPIFQEDRLWGVLSAYQSEKPRSWTEAEANAVKQIALQVEVAMQQAVYQNRLTLTNQQERLITKVINRLRRPTSLPKTLKTVAREIREMLQADRVGMYKFDPTTNYAVGEFVVEDVASGVQSAMAAKIKDHCFAEGQAEKYQKGRYWVVNDVTTLDLPDCLVDLLAELQVRASLVVPLLKGDVLWGLFAIHQCHGPRQWQDSEVEFAHRVGAQLNIALQQADYVDQLNEKNQQLKQVADQERLITRITERLQKTTDLPQTLKMVVRDIRHMLSADRVGLYQFDIATNYSVGEFVVEDVATGVFSAMATKVKDHCFAEDQAEKYRKGRYWVVNDVTTLDLPDCLVELLAQLQVRASLVVPLLKGDILWGLFCVHECNGPRQWQDAEVEFVHRIGAQLNLALKQADYLEQLQEKNAALAATATREKDSKEQLQQQVIQLLKEVRPALEGDLTVRAPVTDSEVGTVASAYNNTLQSLQKIVLEVQQAATQVGKTSQLSEISVSSLNTEAQQQANSLEQALNQVQEMMSLTETVVNDAQRVEVAVQQANQTVQSGDTAMNRTVDGIMAIRSTVANTNQRIKQLSESSQKVSKIVSLISHFTTQTQLLALNASIEATRAGKYGRGFAVVADEVRSLARQSAEAATEIEQLVQEIQVNTAEVSTAMESGIQQVATGTNLVKDARQNLTAIVEATGQISGLIQGITQTTHQQAAEFKEVTLSVTEATEIANQTSQKSEQLTQSIHQLLDTAKTLQTSTGKFKVS